MRHQLAVVHAVAFNASSEDVEGAVLSQHREHRSSHEPPPPASALDDSALLDAPPGGGDVHSLLLRRIRQLESRLVRADAARSEAEAACADLRMRMQAAQDTITDQAALVARLDDALASRLTAQHSQQQDEHGQRAASLSKTPVRPFGASGVAAADADLQGGGPQLLSPQLQLESILGAAAASPSVAIPPDEERGPQPQRASTFDSPGAGHAGNDARWQILQVRRHSAAASG